MNNIPLCRYPLFIGMTRIPMLMGVTQTYFVLNLAGCAIVLLFLLNSLAFLPLILTVSIAFIVLHVIGLIGCSHDERFFDLWLSKFELPCPNNIYWGCSSYDPS